MNQINLHGGSMSFGGDVVAGDKIGGNTPRYFRIFAKEVGYVDMVRPFGVNEKEAFNFIKHKARVTPIRTVAALKKFAELLKSYGWSEFEDDRMIGVDITP